MEAINKHYFLLLRYPHKTRKITLPRFGGTRQPVQVRL